jgi:hypothetical protein
MNKYLATANSTYRATAVELNSVVLLYITSAST